MLLISGVFMTIAMGQMISADHAGRLPDGEAVARTVVRLLSPPGPAS